MVVMWKRWPKNEYDTTLLDAQKNNLLVEARNYEIN